MASFRNKQTEGENAEIGYCEDHGEERVLFCGEHGFTCESCGCISSCDYCEAQDKIPEIINTLKAQIEDLKEAEELNSTATLNQFCKRANELKKQREERKKEVTEKIEKLLKEDTENFKMQYNQVKGHLKSVIEVLDKVAEKYKKESTHAIRLLEALENNKGLADIIRGYEYNSKAEKLEEKKGKRDYTEYEGQLAALKGFQGELDEIDRWVKDNEKSASDNNKILYKIVNGDSEILYCDIESRKSQKYELKDLKQIPLYCGVAASKGSIYIAGGTPDMAEYLDDVWSINVKTGEEKKLPKLITARSENTLLVTRNYIICIGGRNSENFVEDIEIYNPLLDKDWKRAARLTPPRSFIAAVNCEEYKVVYTFGGLGQVDGKVVPMNCLNLLDLKSLTVKDLILNLPEYQKLPGLYCAGMVCTSHKRNNSYDILIFGGVDKDKKERNKVYLLKRLKEPSDAHFGMETLNDLKYEDNFYGQIPILTEQDELHVISRKYIHSYSFSESKESKILEIHEYLSF